MITRVDADDIAAGWAHRESLRRGRTCLPMVEEFDLGFVVWTRQPESVLPIPGDGTTSVIDRETGRLSHWPQVPTDVLEQMYRERRAAIVDPPRTADAEVEVKRNARRRATPAVAAHVTLDGRLFIAKGAKGDQELHHHPLVAQWLQQVEAGHLVRGAQRHAELLVLSDALHEVDRLRAGQGLPPVTLHEARMLLREARFETFHIRERGDPMGGEPADPCESCGEALINFALVSWGKLMSNTVWVLDSGRDLQPGRFPPRVAWELAHSGWKVVPRPDAEAEAERQLAIAEAVPGQEHRVERFPAAFAAFTDFWTIASGRKGPGAQQRIRLFEIRSSAALYNADMLHEFGVLIGARMFPLGAEAFGETVLAIDEHGRVFAFDQGGEWFIGADLDAALINLLTGAHTPRVRDDGTW